MPRKQEIAYVRGKEGICCCTWLGSGAPASSENPGDEEEDVVLVILLKRMRCLQRLRKTLPTLPASIPWIHQLYPLQFHTVTYLTLTHSVTYIYPCTIFIPTQPFTQHTYSTLFILTQHTLHTLFISTAPLQQPLCAFTPQFLPTPCPSQSFLYTHSLHVP